MPDLRDTDRPLARRTRPRTPRSRTAGTAAALAATLFLSAACGATTPQAAAKPAATATSPAPAKLTAVSLRFPFLVAGYDTPVLLALQRGYYRQVGLDLSVAQGQNSGPTIDSVASGHDTFGMADAGTVAEFIGKGAAVKVVADYVQQAPYSFIYLKNHVDFTSPKDLIGRTVFTGEGDADLVVLPAVLARYGMNEKQLHVTFISTGAYPQVLRTNPDAVALGFDNSSYFLIRHISPTAADAPYSAFGVHALSIGVIVKDSTLASRPGLVRAFIAATNRGWQAAIQDPQAAVAATTKLFPQANASLLTSGLRQALLTLHSPASQGRPIGWMAPSDWRSTIDLMHGYAGMKVVKPLSDYYTDAYVPAG